MSLPSHKQGEQYISWEELENKCTYSSDATTNIIFLKNCETDLKNALETGDLNTLHNGLNEEFNGAKDVMTIKLS